MNRRAAVRLVLWVSAITQYPAEVQLNALTTQRLVTKSFYNAHVFRFLCFKFQHEQFRLTSRLLLSHHYSTQSPQQLRSISLAISLRALH